MKTTNNKKQNPVTLVLALIGLFTVLYAGWHLYEKQQTEDEHARIFAAPASSGVPDFLHASPLPPPQP
jgi:hypothetical protein